MSKPSSDPFFRPIGQVVESADSHPEKSEDSVAKGQGVGDAQEDDDFSPVDQIESLCLECGENGMTRMLLTSIPFFREVIVVSFRCEHCGNTNNEIQSAGIIQERGCVYTVKILSRDDLNRQLVKSEFSTVFIPEFELTIPPSKGQLTTVEGIVSDVVRDLAMDQPVREHVQPEVHAKIEQFLEKLRDVIDEEREVRREFPKGGITLRLDDPSGNSFIEAKDGFDDPKWSKREYERTKEQDAKLGLAEAAEEGGEGKTANELSKKVDGQGDEDNESPEEVYTFAGTCPSCHITTETHMKNVNIPHFKDVVLMSTNCENCGYRDNEIKSGGAISEKGRKIILKVTDPDDLSRDILKASAIHSPSIGSTSHPDSSCPTPIQSESCGLTIPEIDLHLHPGTLGGRFTTLEGLLNQVYEELDEKVFASGDSAIAGKKDSMEDFLRRLKEAIAGTIEFSVILDDPLASSYLQNPYAPDPDPNMTIESYDRTEEQNGELGLLDMRVEEGTYGEEFEKREREEQERLVNGGKGVEGTSSKLEELKLVGDEVKDVRPDLPKDESRGS